MEFKVSDQHRCPKCGGERAKIIWISEDRKTIAGQCPSARSHMHKKDTVMLIDA